MARIILFLPDGTTDEKGDLDELTALNAAARMAMDGAQIHVIGDDNLIAFWSGGVGQSISGHISYEILEKITRRKEA